MSDTVLFSENAPAEDQYERIQLPHLFSRTLRINQNQIHFRIPLKLLVQRKVSLQTLQCSTVLSSRPHEVSSIKVRLPFLIASLRILRPGKMEMMRRVGQNAICCNPFVRLRFGW